ncbi:MAG: mechanosensitive ion channel family protein [Candidatus Halalkalibacterium sp. M3_1C_030]
MLYKTCLRISIFIVSLFLFAYGAYAQQSDSLKTAEVTSNATQLLSSPRRSVHTFMHWQQEGHKRPELVIQTMKLADNYSDEQKLELANKLKKVLDSRGLLIEYEEVPNDPSYTDSLTGLNQYILFPSLPEVYLTKKNDQWLFSEATIQEIPEVYSDTFSIFVDLVVDHIPESMQKEWLGVQVWQYIAIFTWILLGFVFRLLFEFVFENYIRRLTAKTRTSWDDQLFFEVEKPLSFLFMMSFYWLTYTNLQLSVTVTYYLALALEIAVSASFIWLIYNLVNVLSGYLSELTSKTESQLDDQLVPLIRKTLKVFVVILGVIFILQNNGINVTSLLAGLGLGGLAFALAARDTLANFFGSITIFMDKPFQVGDLIKTSNAEGVVEEIGFRSTRLRTLYNSVISVPNSNLAVTEIDNLGLREYRRMKMMLNLTYSTTPKQMEAFVEGIKAIINANEHIRQDLYEVHFNEYGAHSLDVLVYIFFDVPGWSEELQQRHNFLLEVYRLADEVGVEFAFPTQTLHIDSVYKDSPRKVGKERSEDELGSTVYAFGPGGELSKPGGITLQKEGKEINFSSSKE